MSTGGIVALVIGGLALLFFAASKGLIAGGVPVGKGIVAPQPATNYGGYLAASTAPAVSGLLNAIISGVTKPAASILSPASTPAAPVAQGTTSASPALAASPSGPSNQSFGDLAAAFGTPTPIGPVTTPDVAYNATPGSAFDYTGLANDNSWDQNASLEFAV